jgi:hypothetical protein
MIKLDNGHWTHDNYSQRMAYADWRDILLAGGDQIIYKGQMVPLKATDLGYGVVLVAKYSASSYEFDSIDLIKAERERQITKEGYTAGHDASFAAGDLALAAACYAMPSRLRPADDPPNGWPFDNDEWKPTPNDRIRELVKAGALIAAEIDRVSLAKIDTQVS